MIDVSTGKRRALFVLDQGIAREEAIACAVDLSARLSAQLRAVFIEDASLLRAYALPLREGERAGRGRTPPDGPAISHTWQAFSAFAREVLVREAGRRHVALEFRVARGERVEELAREEGAGHLFVLNRTQRPGRSSTYRSAHASLGLERVCVVVDEKRSAQGALEVALDLVTPGGHVELWATPSAREAVLAGPSLKDRRVTVRDYPQGLGPDWVRRVLASATDAVVVAAADTQVAQVARGMWRDGNLPCWMVITAVHTDVPS